MKVQHKRDFLKGISHISSAARKPIEEFIFELLPKLDSIQEIRNLKKLQGTKNSYRIRFGSYRVGLRIDGDLVTVVAVDHRSTFYRNFP